MNQFPKHEQMQMYGCNALRNLANHELSTKQQIVLIEDRGIEVILAAMKEFPENSGVQESAVGCLRNIALRQPASATAIIQKGGIEAVLVAMENHLKADEVQKCACRFLRTLLANHEAARNLIREKGGGVTLAKVELHFQGECSEITSKTAGLLRQIYSH
jgi:hypothetical protein